ncbi:MAG: hypothetical protein JWM90_2070 [Thermoleophilia bacterium]|nr:hypothetical protein [Thermoleophilia bacterium]
MQLLQLLTSTLAAGLLVLVVPGATLLALLRVDRVVPPPLVPAAAVALGFVPIGVATAIALWLKQPIWTITVALAVLVVLGWFSLAARVRREDGRRNIPSLLVPLRALVAGTWLRATPWGTWLVALAAGGIAVGVGFHAWNDSLYHIGQAQKLLALDAPSFTNTLQFPDGSAHPGYLLPLWQETLAQVAFVARVDPVEVIWILPGVTVAIATLAMGGLGWTLTRARRASTPIALAWVLVACLGPLPLADAIFNSMHPGGIALWILMPLVLAMLFVALWPEQNREHGAVDMATSTVTRAATLIAATATAAFGVLHVSNLVILAMGMLGYLLIWALRAPWPRRVVLRHLAVFGSVALVAATCVVLLLPGLSELQSFGKDAASELQANESDLYAGKNGAPLEALLRGDVAGEAYHLRADYLVLGGGFALLGLIGLLLALYAPRWPAGWFLLGTGLLVLGIALSDRVFPSYVDVVSLDQARRIEKALPLSVGLGLLALATAAAALRLWHAGSAIARGAAGFLIALVATATWLLADRVLVMQGYGGPQLVEPRVITTLLVLFALGFVLFAALLIVRLVRGPRVRAHVEQRIRLAAWEWPTTVIGSGVGVLATALLLFGAVPATGRVTDMFDSKRLVKLPTTQRTGELRVFSVQAAEQLRKLPVGSTILADPRSRDPYAAMALAPVYVVSSVPRHTASTPENRVEERFRTAVSFFDKEGGSSPAASKRRIKVLIDNDVDAVVVHPRSVARALLDDIGARLVARGQNQFMYVLQPETLERAAAGLDGRSLAVASDVGLAQL